MPYMSVNRAFMLSIMILNIHFSVKVSEMSLLLFDSVNYTDGSASIFIGNSIQ